jgi:nitrate reductase molybdenum cofactor assembly chaperone NarJ/NarW
MVAPQGTEESRILGLFADLLEYPRCDVAQAARDCRALLAPVNAEAAALLAEFVAFAERTPRNMIEEVFTATFDLNASCHPYIGYHMFGEAYQRSALLLELQGRFREHGFDPGSELPDHIAVLLRFMSVCPDAEIRQEIGREAILRTLGPMTIVPEAEVVEDEQETPEIFDVGVDYRRVLLALQMILLERYGAPQELEPIPIPDKELLVS